MKTIFKKSVTSNKQSLAMMVIVSIILATAIGLGTFTAHNIQAADTTYSVFAESNVAGNPEVGTASDLYTNGTVSNEVLPYIGIPEWRVEGSISTLKLPTNSGKLANYLESNYVGQFPSHEFSAISLLKGFFTA